MMSSTARVGLSAALIVIYGFFVIIFGFYISTIAYLIAHSWTLGQRNWLLLILVPLAICLVLYLLVEYFLGISLPRGVFFRF